VEGRKYLEEDTGRRVKMTLDEAINYCEEKARELRTPRAYTDIEGNLRATETCEECAREHEQLAEWLKELKALKEGKGDLISREALKEQFTEGAYTSKGVREIIDNAPTVSDRYDEGYAQGYIDGSTGADMKGGAE
jgi:hypothetical protein